MKMSFAPSCGRRSPRQASRKESRERVRHGLKRLPDGELTWKYAKGLRDMMREGRGDAVDLWDLINRQDWSVCERTQKGTHSRAWKGGRFSAQESQVHDFEKYISKRMKEPIDSEEGHRPRQSPRRRGRRPRAA